MKRIALVLCAAIATLGTGAAAGAQGTEAVARPAEGVVGTASTVDETTLAIGEGTGGAQAAGSAVGPTTFSYFLRMVVVLALVVAAIYGIYRLMRRVSGPRRAEDDSLKLLASRSLGPGKAVHVVAAGSKAYLIGVGDSSVSLIAQLDDKEYVDALLLKESQGQTSSRQGIEFGEMLSSLLGRKRDGAGKRGSDGAFLAEQRKRLTRL